MQRAVHTIQLCLLAVTQVCMSVYNTMLPAEHDISQHKVVPINYKHSKLPRNILVYHVSILSTMVMCRYLYTSALEVL